MNRHFALKRRPLSGRSLTAAAAGLLFLSSCGAVPGEQPAADSWAEVTAQAQGQTVKLWMYGGDEQGNGFGDGYLIPASGGTVRSA